MIKMCAWNVLFQLKLPTKFQNVFQVQIAVVVVLICIEVYIGYR